MIMNGASNFHHCHHYEAIRSQEKAGEITKGVLAGRVAKRRQK